jgi:hypothetical protein
LAYGDNKAGALYRWPFDGDLLDEDGLGAFTAGGTDFVSTTISRDTTQSLRSNDRSDDASQSVPNYNGLIGTLDSGGGLSFWFQIDGIQGPPVSIVHIGGSSAGYGVIIWAGNNAIFNWYDPSVPIQQQIYTDIALTSNRPYHFALFHDKTEGKFKGFLDGVRQLSAVPSDATYGTPGGFDQLATGGLNIFEPPTSQILIGGEIVLLRAPITGLVSNLWAWGTTFPSDSDVRQIVFEEGAPPDLIISSGTESAMQAQLDAIADTQRPDWPLCIQVNEVTGGGDLNLNADNVTFSPRASIHVRYEGSGTLFWTNTNGSNASIVSGNVTVLNPFTLTLTNIQNPTEVRVYEAGTTNEVAGQENVTTSTFAATISVSSVDIRFVSLDFRIFTIKNVDINDNVTISVQQFIDRVYSNPA